MLLACGVTWLPNRRACANMLVAMIRCFLKYCFLTAVIFVACLFSLLRVKVHSTYLYIYINVTLSSMYNVRIFANSISLKKYLKLFFTPKRKKKKSLVGINKQLVQLVLASTSYASTCDWNTSLILYTTGRAVRLIVKQSEILIQTPTQWYYDKLNVLLKLRLATFTLNKHSLLTK